MLISRPFSSRSDFGSSPRERINEALAGTSPRWCRPPHPLHHAGPHHGQLLLLICTCCKCLPSRAACSSARAASACRRAAQGGG
uniref:Uncharacterized protein n=1 Tax=Arundo donax TaxID=35708 RepID=A0A0A8YYF3_ARUDO